MIKNIWKMLPIYKITIKNIKHNNKRKQIQENKTMNQKKQINLNWSMLLQVHYVNQSKKFQLIKMIKQHKLN